jgi:endonuclease YncB( thermonuclease family)
VAPRLVENGGNDGDSFFIAHDGGQERYRLYFVDTPETSRRYPARLGHQARYFGGISFDRLTSGGSDAREFTLQLLRRHELEVWTKNERVMDSDRLHALVRFPGMAGQPWLHEELVKTGLARIYTLPTDLPDGTPKEQHLRQLKDLETGARRDKRGLWGK